MGWLGVVLLALVGTAASAQPYDQTRVSSFGYYTSGDGAKNGLLSSETIEPGNTQLGVTTSYTHDSYGNKISGTTTNWAGATGRAVFTSRTSYSTFAAQTVIITSGSISVAIPAGTFATTSTNALNQSETKTYDPRFGTVLTLTGPNALATSWQVDDLGRKTRELRADGTSTANYYCYLIGRFADYSTNSPGCPAPSAVDFPAPAATEIPADAIAFIYSEPRNTSGAKNGHFTRVYTDRAGRKLRSVTEAFDDSSQTGGPGRLIVQDTDYNIYGAQTVSTQPYFLDTGSSAASGNAVYGMTRTDYDVLGRAVAVYSTDGGGTNTTAIAFGNRSSFRAAKTSVLYEGLKTTTTNDQGQARIEEKNADGKLVRVTDALGAQIAYQHDSFGNLKLTQDALQNQVKLDYDGRGRKTKLTDPDTGVWQYDYNALGELVWQQSANQLAASPATATTMVYDQLGRMSSRTEPEYTSSWLYDTCSKGIGKLCESYTDNGVNHKLAYDNLGRPIGSRTSITANATFPSGPAFGSAVSYDSANGRLDTQTYPTGLRVKYNYTGKGFLRTLTLLTSATVNPLPQTVGGTPAAGTTLASGATLWQAQAYNARGQAEQQSVGNGVISKAVFDTTTGRITGMSAGLASATNVAQQGYAWDSLGRLTQRNDANGDDPNSDISAGAITDDYTYDTLGRLSAYKVSATKIPGTFRDVALQYNAAGMLLYKSDVGVFTYGAQNTAGVKPHALQAVTTTSSTTTHYTFDANGNLVTADAGKYRSIAYTSFNLPDSNNGAQGPAGGSKYTWAYDESHQRIMERQVTAAGTRTTWQMHPDNVGGLGFESESTGAATPTNRHYLSVGGLSIGVLVSQGALPNLAAWPAQPTALTTITLVRVEYWHKDPLGSLLATTDHAGAVTARYSYDPFGKRRTTHGQYDPFGTVVYDWTTNTNHGTDRGYTGHEHLDDLGVIHMNGRLFDPSLGRFMQGDPMIQDPGNLQNYDRYGYCYNNPLTCSDPSGLSFNPINWLKWIDPVGFKINSAVAHNQYGYTIGSIAIAAASAYYCGQAGPAAAAGCNAAGQAAWAGFAGKSFEDQLKTGAIAGATSYAFSAVGTQWAGAGTTGATSTSIFLNTVGHAAVGCVSSSVSGGSCRSGAISSGLSAAWGNYGPGYAGGMDPTGAEIVQNTLASAAVGGIGSVASGGKFKDGAVTGAFGYLFNFLLHRDVRVSRTAAEQFDISFEPPPLAERELGWAGRLLDATEGRMLKIMQGISNFYDHVVQGMDETYGTKDITDAEQRKLETDLAKRASTFATNNGFDLKFMTREQTSNLLSYLQSTPGYQKFYPSAEEIMKKFPERKVIPTCVPGTEC